MSLRWSVVYAIFLPPFQKEVKLYEVCSNFSTVFTGMKLFIRILTPEPSLEMKKHLTPNRYSDQQLMQGEGWDINNFLHKNYVDFNFAR
jgi:hypothetical protein